MQLLQRHPVNGNDDAADELQSIGGERLANCRAEATGKHNSRPRLPGRTALGKVQGQEDGP
jgi:hypothetical protein